MEYAELVAEIQLVISEIENGSCLAIVDGNRGTDISTDLSNLIADLLTDYLEEV